MATRSVQDQGDRAGELPSTADGHRAAMPAASATVPASPSPRTSEEAGFGGILAAWIALVVVIQLVGWGSGLRGGALAAAVARGTARVEQWSVGEVGDELIRKAIRTQQETLPFWATLAAIGDFLVEPGWLIFRVLGASVLFGGIAALWARPVRFGPTLAAVAAAQGIWVAGLALRVLLALVLGQATMASTSATLCLGPGQYSAVTWVALEQLDVFAALGWVAVGLAGRRQGQVGWIGALTVALTLWSFEAFWRIAGRLLLEAGMRMTLISG